MKRILTAAILVFIMTGAAYSQNQFSIKGGVNFANLAVDEDEIDENNTKAGFTFGIVNRTNFEGALGFQAELLYTQKGAKYQIAGTNVDANLDYLELPLSLQLRLLGSPLSVYAGGYAAYLLNAKYKYESNLFSGVIEYDDRDGFNDFDYGIMAGLNLDLGAVIVDGRFARGGQDVEANDKLIDTQPFTANKTKNFGFVLTVGILF